eukprot:TRINITY_DN2590_c0_g1_i1.p1 TRINITY_DN2590_c0_g1~~TRINITY_DN2590_c0_g1_i1.p1  ORF type:complete len:583 (+),score=20.74 TRINITY_DN2590_c0_g1_i1:92-1750(+)
MLNEKPTAITRVCDKSHEHSVIALCKTDQMFICGECLKAGHLEHNRVFISTLAKNLLSYAQEVLNCVEDAVQNFDCIFASLNKDDVIALLRARVEDAFDRAMHQLAEYRDKLLEEMLSYGVIKEIINNAQCLSDQDKALKMLQKEVELTKREIQNLVDQKDYMGAVGLHQKLTQYDANVGELSQYVNDCTMRLQNSVAKVESLAQDRIVSDFTIDKVINPYFFEKLQGGNIQETKPLDCTVTSDTTKGVMKQDLDELLVKIENTHGKEITIYNIPAGLYHNLRFSRDFKVPLNFAVIEHPCDSILYITGGWLADKYRGDTYEYSLSRGKITKKASMKVPRRSHAGTFCKMPIVCGGENSEGHLNACEMFDYSKNVWLALPPLNEKKSYCSATNLGDTRIYVFGGYTYVNGVQKKFDTIEFLDFLEEPIVWKVLKLVKKSPWTARQDAGCIQISDEEILIFGGYDGNSKKDSMILNTDTGIMEQTGSLPSEDRFYQRNPKTIKEKVFAMGGTVGNLWVFDIKTHKWACLIFSQFLQHLTQLYIYIVNLQSDQE